MAKPAFIFLLPSVMELRILEFTKNDQVIASDQVLEEGGYAQGIDSGR